MESTLSVLARYRPVRTLERISMSADSDDESDTSDKNKDKPNENGKTFNGVKEPAGPARNKVHKERKLEVTEGSHGRFLGGASGDENTGAVKRKSGVSSRRGGKSIGCDYFGTGSAVSNRSRSIGTRSATDRHVCTVRKRRKAKRRKVVQSVRVCQPKGRFLEANYGNSAEKAAANDRVVVKEARGGLLYKLLVREIAIHRHLNGAENSAQFIVPFIEGEVFPDRALLVTRFEPLGDLSAFIGACRRSSITTARILQWTASAFEALFWLHRVLKMVHCDAKTQNFLVCSSPCPTFNAGSDARSALGGNEGCGNGGGYYGETLRLFDFDMTWHESSFKEPHAKHNFSIFKRIDYAHFLWSLDNDVRERTRRNRKELRSFVRSMSENSLQSVSKTYQTLRGSVRGTTEHSAWKQLATHGLSEADESSKNKDGVSKASGLDSGRKGKTGKKETSASALAFAVSHDVLTLPMTVSPSLQF